MREAFGDFKWPSTCTRAANMLFGIAAATEPGLPDDSSCRAPLIVDRPVTERLHERPRLQRIGFKCVPENSQRDLVQPGNAFRQTKS